MKRPSDCRSVYLRVRLTKAQRAHLRRHRKRGESLSDAARRLLFPPPVEPSNVL